jgi:hypothetical protein
VGNAHGGPWHYTARYTWNWRSARAIGKALGGLALPMPPWFRAVVARCLVTRTALHADAHGIWGSANASPDACPWKEVAEVVVWQYDGLRVVGVAHRADALAGNPATVGPGAKPLPSHAPQQPTRRRTFRRHPSYPAFIAPDGSPYGVGNVLTTNGWCVDVRRLQATVTHFAPRARFVDLSTLNAGEREGGPVEIIEGLLELIGWRRLGWLLGVAASIAVLAIAATNMTTAHSPAAPVGVVVGALALASFTWRAVAVRRHRRHAAHPEAWLDSARETRAGALETRLSRSRLAAWTIRANPLARRRARRPIGRSRRR